MRLSAILLVILMLEPSPAVAAKVHQRLARCATVVEEILNVPDGLPRELLDKAECVVVIPSMKKFALGIGGSYGRGAMTCRRGENFTGSWGPPAMVRLEGGNIGFQLGGQATDFFLLVMNPKGAESMLKSKVKLGADAAAVAGPKGRAAEAATDAYMRAEILRDCHITSDSIYRYLRQDLVVPFSMEGIAFNVECGDLFIGDLEAGRVEV